ncbi:MULTISPECIES: DNA polymerase Y family protein [unclassified Methylobacterium]|uniref:Y-family DNA polymerase n=1 Tax=unclassified Methylobacterium TaxID=2615210 RepID=UPI001FEDCC90|nr:MULTISPECIES: DNA polymerase Y family protein [unclassified Methylobacterium]
MPRIVSICLTEWPVARLMRAGAAPDDGVPLVIAAAGAGGLRLTAVNPAAAALGLRRGEPLGRVRARISTPLHVHPADPAADAAAFARLCLWAQRYTPCVVPFGPAEACDGLYLDVTGAAHLLGGEADLVADLAARLARSGIPARIALADTPGAAFALARYGRGETMCVPSERTEQALRPLPVEALRCEPAVAVALKRLGLRRIGAVLDAPRPPLARRFGAALLVRLDQAAGCRPEPLVPVTEPVRYGAARGFLDPIGSQEIIVATVRRLMAEIAPRLEADGLGARGFRLSLHRVDDVVRALDLGLSEPSRSPDHVARLLQLRLERLGSGLDAGFGFETVRLDVSATGPMPGRQATLATGPAPQDDRTAGLADALRQRFGRPVIRLSPRASHVPERADRIAPWHTEPWRTEPWRIERVVLHWPDPDAGIGPRPLVLFDRGEAAEDVIALVPEGPPRRFRWRSRLHRIAHSEGPERIEPEWWREAGVPRDYYVVECESGRRLWLYRDGPNLADRPAAWFVHGLFA